MNTAFPLTHIAAALALAFLSASCAGVKCSVRADRLDQPASFTPCVFDASGKIVRPTAQDKLKHFKLRKHCWAMLWRNVNLTDNQWDLSDELRQEIASARGDAIVNLTVKSRGDGWWYVSSLIPLLPDYHLLEVEGDVVRVPGAGGAL